MTVAVVMAFWNLFLRKSRPITMVSTVIITVLLVIGFYFMYRLITAVPDGVDATRAVSHWEWGLPPRLVWTYPR